MLYAAAFAVRLAYAWVAAGPHATPFSDAAEYDQVAWNLARGAGFAFGLNGVHPTAFVPPLLPWIVSLLYRAAGHHYFAALVILYFMLGSVVFWGALRLRVPIAPLLALLSAIGFEDARLRVRRRSSGFRVIEGRRKAS